MEAFGILMMLGVRVREVHRLDEGAVWLPRRRLLLIDAGLSEAQRAEAAAAFLPDALAG